MFGFLSRKLHPTTPSSATTDPAPAPPSPAAEPPATPSPPLAEPEPITEPITDPKALHSLIASVPAQTLHAYTLAHLIPPSQPLSPLTFPHIPIPTDPPAAETLTALTHFFANLVPPPRLHCVRCHKSYFEVENTDRSCLVPHNDESAEVERVGASGRRNGIGTEYETLWGCCGKTVEGDGDMGPPDGWCYEGKHTTDIKRARFRADSTPQDDKLVSCERLRCNQPLSSSPGASRSRANKRRRTLMEEADNEDAQSSVDGSTLSSSSNIIVDEPTTTRKPKRARHSKPVSTSSKSELNKDNEEDDDTAIDVDVDPTEETKSKQVPATPKSTSRPRKPRKSGEMTTTTPGPKSTKSKAKSPLVSSFTPPSPPVENDSALQIGKDKTSLVRNRAIVEITTERDGSPRLSLRKSSNISLPDAPKSDNDIQSEKETVTKAKPKSRARKDTAVENATTTTPKTPRVTSRSKKAAADDSTTIESTTPASSAKPRSSRTVKPKSSVASLNTSTNANTSVTTTVRPGSTGKRRGKALGEVVVASVEGEKNS